MNGKVIAVGFVAIALGVFGYVRNGIGDLIGSGAGCKGGVCAASGSDSGLVPVPVVSAQSVPELVIYLLFAVGLLVIVTGLVMRGAKEAT